MIDDATCTTYHKEKLKLYESGIYNDGFVIVRDCIDRQVVDLALQKIKNIINEISPKELDQNKKKGLGYINDLQNKDIYFIKTIFNHPVLRTLLISILNDPYYRKIPSDKPNYIFRGIRTLDSVPEALPLHIDSILPSSSVFPTGLTAAFILEDHTKANGCTVVVPKSHRSDRFADRSIITDLVPLEANSGDMIIWDTRLWHGTLANPNKRSRLSLLCTFTSWHLKQPFQHCETIPNYIYQDLTDEEKSIIGFCSIPAREKTKFQQDGKFGYKVLKKEV